MVLAVTLVAVDVVHVVGFLDFLSCYHLTYLSRELYLNGLNGTVQQKTIGFLSFGGD